MTSISDEASAAASDDRKFFGHPKGLALLFFTEMWERFSYYGMRALLVTYLIWHFLHSESHAYGVFAAYAGMIYLAPLAGGYLADKYLGARKAVAFGAILITLGHFAMAFEGRPASEILVVGDQSFEITRAKNPEDEGPQFVRSIIIDGARYRVERFVSGKGASAGAEVDYRAESGEIRTVRGRLTRDRDNLAENMMFLALALLIVGTGFLKANISAVVGSLYGDHDRRRDSGFTIFYLGINIGAFVGIGGLGYIGIEYGWSYGFGLAGVGMLLGLAAFLSLQHWLAGRGDPPEGAALETPVFGRLTREWAIYLGALVSVGLAWLVVKYLGQFGLADVLHVFGVSVDSVPLVGEFTLFDLIVNLVFIGSIGAVLTYSMRTLEREERDRVITLIVLTFSSVVFWTLFDQAPISLIIFQGRFVDTGDLTAQQIGLFNPAFILIFAPILTYLWHALGARGRDLATPAKFAAALMQIGLGFLVLNLGILIDGDDLTISLLWVAMMYLLHTTGELCLSPVGLSAVTKLSPKRMVGFMMGIWFIAVALAQVGASLVSKATIVPEGTPPAEALAQFNSVYFWVGMASVLAGLLVAVVSPKLKTMMHGRL